VRVPRPSFAWAGVLGQTIQYVYDALNRLTAGGAPFRAEVYDTRHRGWAGGNSGRRRLQVQGAADERRLRPSIRNLSRGEGRKNRSKRVRQPPANSRA
jgi:hypothetical protein